MRGKSIRPARSALFQSRASSSLAERLQGLTTRTLPLTYDYLHPQPSHLLNLTLLDLLRQPPSDHHTTLPSITNPPRLPPGHHLIYFPPQVPLSQLLPDGTDTLHTPGEPFDRRLWAGGSVKFADPELLLNGRRAVCIESIRNVAVKGREGDEKVIVTIERRVGTVPEEEAAEKSWERIWQRNADDPGESAVVENRDLIFMRPKSEEQLQHDQEQFGARSRIVKREKQTNYTGRFNKKLTFRSAPFDPAFRHVILPTPALLFRFSALTFNAHSIHLDKNYTRHREGYRNLLVHGPLTLTLLLSVMQRHVDHPIRSIEYRNWAPVYVEEEMAICGKRKSTGAWDVWIEGPDGGLAVRGTLTT